MILYPSYHLVSIKYKLNFIPSEERSSYLSLSSSDSMSLSSSSCENSPAPGLRRPPEREEAEPASATELVDSKCLRGSRRCQIYVSNKQFITLLNIYLDETITIMYINRKQEQRKLNNIFLLSIFCRLLKLSIYN